MVGGLGASQGAFGGRGVTPRLGHRRVIEGQRPGLLSN